MIGELIVIEKKQATASLLDNCKIFITYGLE